MSILFASNYEGSFKSISDQATEATGSTNVDTTYSDSGMAGSFVFQTPTFVSELTEGWIHGTFYGGGTTSGARTGDILQGYNTVRGGPDFSLSLSADTASFKFWNGTALTALTLTYAMASGTRADWDIYFKKHATAGILRLYKGGALVLEELGLNTSNFAVNCVRVRGFNSPGSAVWSQIIVADESTIGMKLFSPNLSVGNSNTFAAGTAADVDVNSVVNFNTYMTGSVNAQQATFAVENLPAGSLVAKAVAVNMRAKKGSTGPSLANMVARVAAVDYNHATNHALTVGIDPFSVVYNVNPASGLAWDNTTLDASEFGVRVTT